MKNLIVVVGPTAVGKTKVAIALSQKFDVPVINADSRQLYRELPIGTAAPTEEEQKAARHYFVGIKELDDYYSASMYEQDVMRLLEEKLYKTSDTALMCGGSMMYVDAVCNGIDDIPTIDKDIRESLNRRYEMEGLDRLLSELKLLDPEYYKEIDMKNPRRVIHALEVCYQTGKSYSSFRLGDNGKKNTIHRPFRTIKIGLTLSRTELFERINTRTEKMMDNGFLKEAESVYPKRHLNALNTVGYKELFSFFDGTMTIGDAVKRIQKNTRVYAKKQMTWFKRDEDIKWFSPSDITNIVKYINNYE